MSQRRIRKRISRPATPEEKARHKEIRQKIEGERPRLNRIGLETKAAYEQRKARLREVCALLKSTREAAGLSLAEMSARTGIDKANLSRLENAEDANPTMDTLQRYADALDRQLVVSLAEKTESSY